MVTKVSVTVRERVKVRKIEDRLDALEKFRDKALPVLEAAQKVLEISKEKFNPFSLCKDGVDRQIIDYLIEHKAAGTSELAEALQLDNPKVIGRHVVGKRIIRMKEVFERNGWHVLDFHPENKEGKFRAWWLSIEDIDVEGFRKNLAGENK